MVFIAPLCHGRGGGGEPDRGRTIGVHDRKGSIVTLFTREGDLRRFMYPTVIMIHFL